MDYKGWNHNLNLPKDFNGDCKCPCKSKKKFKNCCKDMFGLYCKLMLRKCPDSEMRQARISGIKTLAKEGYLPKQLWCYMRTGQMFDDARAHTFSKVMLKQWQISTLEFNSLKLRTVEETVNKAIEVLESNW